MSGVHWSSLLTDQFYQQDATTFHHLQHMHSFLFQLCPPVDVGVVSMCASSLRDISPIF